MSAFFNRWAAVSFLTLLGCGPARGNINLPSTTCMAGAQQACTCDDARNGTSTCGLDLHWADCVCTDSDVSGLDAVVPDVTLPSNDIQVTVDRTAPVDTGIPPGQLGRECTRLGDCATGVCLPSGRCSRNCAGPGDCPASIGWSCTSLPGLGPVCDCTPRGSEVCNGLDDNCNGVADEGFERCNGACTSLASDDNNCGRCGVRCGGGTHCAAGVCSCPAGRPLACGGACVDPTGDPNNCGGCNRQCSSSQRCSAGSCVPLGPVCPSVCSSSVECESCGGPDDPPGTAWCCASGMCLATAGSCGPRDGGVDVPPLDVVDLNDVSLFPDINLFD